MVTTKKTLSRSYSLTQYLRKQEKTSEKHEFYDGLIVKKTDTTFYQIIISLNTTSAIFRLLEEFTILGSHQQIYIESENVVLYPDALVIAGQLNFYKGQKSLLTNPVVIIEVLSKPMSQYNHADRFNFYKSLPSFKEYVLIDQKSIFVETRFQEAPDVWRYSTYKASETEVPLRSLGISVKMDDIYKKVVF
jgi:Uma2 family endonuclease